MSIFDLSQVRAVYSGRKGCACGCRGKYSYASAHKDARPSYYEADEGVSDRTVKLLTAKAERLLAEGSEVEHVMFADDFIAIDLAYSDRTYTLYFEGK